MKLNHRLARWFKLRFAILYPFVAWALLSLYATDRSLRQGFPFVILGIAIRSWANGYAIKMEKLTTSGPYAHVRHPLYLGTFFIFIGFLVMLRVNWGVALLLIGVVMGLVYRSTISKEEKMLVDKFGEGYLDYRKAVPALFPKVVPYRLGEKWKPSLRRYWRSQEYKLVIWVVIVTIAFHLKHELLIEREGFDGKIIFLIAMVCALVALDLVSNYFRKRNNVASV